jgi:O-antigen biosynthesis protein
MSRKNRQPKSVSRSPVIDVVITTAGRFDMLEKCLDALYLEAQTTPLSIILIDNNSVMSERVQFSHLFQYHPEKDPMQHVTFYTKRLAQNTGFPQSNNDGARMGHAQLILFLNDDVELHEGSLAKIVESFKDQTVAVVGIKLLFPPNSTSPIRPAGKVQHIGIALNIRGEPIHPLVSWSPDHPKTNVLRDAWAVTGACLTVRRQLFQKAGGFDTVYGMGTYEDADLCLKMRQGGFRVYVQTGATAYHYAGATQEKKRWGYPLQMNLQIFQSRWGASGFLVWDEYSYW